LADFGQFASRSKDTGATEGGNEDIRMSIGYRVRRRLSSARKACGRGERGDTSSSIRTALTIRVGGVLKNGTKVSIDGSAAVMSLRTAAREEVLGDPKQASEGPPVGVGRFCDPAGKSRPGTGTALRIAEGSIPSSREVCKAVGTNAVEPIATDGEL
jgi:hypothetical protein